MGVSVSQCLSTPQNRVLFLSEELCGVVRYKRLAGDGTRAVYIAEHVPTGKIKGLFEKTSSGYVRCKAELLVELLPRNIYKS